MMNRFDHIWHFIAQHEGGFTDSLADGAGATHHGITQVSLDLLWKNDQAWMHAHHMPTRTLELSAAQAKALAQRFYWEIPDLQLLPPPIDLVMVDWYFHGGPAIPSLNRLLGVPGRTLKEATVQAASLDPRVIASNLVELRRQYLQSLKSWPRFAKNWSRRLEDLRQTI